VNGYKNQFVNLWRALSIDKLLLEYFIWKDNPLNINDEDWPYTDLVEKICKSYDITREHPINSDADDVLKNSHMLRLLKIKTMGVGFDGSKEKLEEILETLFPSDGAQRYVVKTLTTGVDHAAAVVYLIKAADDSKFDATDVELFEGGYYFLKLLGITLTFEFRNRDALLYDNTGYDTNKYDGGGSV